jgi:uncharacterized protein YggE
MFSLENFLKLKKYKIFLLIIIVLVAIILPAVIVISYGAEIATKLKSYHYIGAGLQYTNTISVSGEGKVYTKPDIALVNLSVVSEGKKVADVQNENTSKTNKVIKFLKESGVEEKDIKTTGYNLYPVYNYEARTPQIVGYSITQTVEVKVRNLDKVGDILEGAVTNGANQISSLYFKVDKDEEFKEQARKLAIEDAKDKAEKLASQLGVKLIKISGYNEGGGVSPIYRDVKAEGYGIGGGASPDIQIGESEIIIDVTLIYEID